MTDDTSRDNEPHPDDGREEAGRGARTPPTIDLEASHVETEGADAPASEASDGGGPAAVKPSRGATALIALGAGALAALVVTGVEWAATRHDPNAMDTPTIATLETLGARLNRLEEAPARPAKPDAALTERLDGFDKTIGELREQLAALQAKNDSLGQALDALKAAPRPAPPPPTPEQPSDDEHHTEQQQTQVESSLKALAADIAVLRDAQAKLEQRTAAEADAAKQAGARAVHAGDAPVRAAVAALALDLAVRQGAPFATELALVRRAGVDEAALKPLQPFADKGVPDPATLGHDLQSLLPAQPQPATSSSTVRAMSGGWFERLEASAARLVKLRRVDAADNEDDTTGVARAAAMARRGDLVAARREIATLSEPLRVKFQPWLDAVAARDAALAASRRIATEAMAALSKSPAP